MAAVLSRNINDITKLTNFMDECKAMKIERAGQSKRFDRAPVDAAAHIHAFDEIVYGSEWSAFVAFFDDAFDHIDADAFYGGETETDVARLVHTEPSDGFIDVGAFYGYFHGNRKHGKSPIVYDIPVMEQYLKDTYGVTVYQEQVMLLSRLLANFTRGESDTLRKAMGKKLIDKMNHLKGKFMEGGQANGHPVVRPSL